MGNSMDIRSLDYKQQMSRFLHNDLCVVKKNQTDQNDIFLFHVHAHVSISSKSTSIRTQHRRIYIVGFEGESCRRARRG